MAEGKPPVTRLRVAPEPLLKVTTPFFEREKLFQSMMPCKVDWLMVRALPAAEMLPAPAVKAPPEGTVEAAWMMGCRAVSARMTPVRKRRGLGGVCCGMRCNDTTELSAELVRSWTFFDG